VGLAVAAGIGVVPVEISPVSREVSELVSNCSELSNPGRCGGRAATARSRLNQPSSESVNAPRAAARATGERRAQVGSA
jgi:hypothetical protein